MNCKKLLIITILSLALVVFGAACGDDDPSSRTSGSQSQSVNDVLEEGMAEADEEDSEDRRSGVNADAPLPEDVAEDVSLSSTEGIDIDLTELSSTMVYSEVYNIMMDPEAYLGKVIKMDGMFTVYHDEVTDQYYYGCIIMDATACCSQGLEFVPKDALVYPEDFPEEGGMVTVTGTFDIYEEDGYKYCTLRNATMEV